MTSDTPPTSETPATRAGEYVLGTLAGAECEAFRAALATDPQLQAEVREWERRLAPLAGAAGRKVRRPRSGARSRGGWRLGKRHRQRREPRRRTRPRPPSFVCGARSGSGGDRGDGRGARGGPDLFVVANALWPGIVVPHPYGQEYVAVVNRGGDLPALILRVDTRKGIVSVRTLGAEAPPGRSLELWYIAAGKAPKSLGIVENTPAPVVVPAVLRDGVAGATIAVTAEPKGGSPTGSPTGPIVYSGKLVEVQR